MRSDGAGPAHGDADGRRAAVVRAAGEPNHPELFAQLGTLAVVRRRVGRVDEAEPLLREALEALEADRRMLVPGASEIAAVERALGTWCAAPAGSP